MFKGIASFFGRLIGAQGNGETHTEPPKEVESTIVFSWVIALGDSTKDGMQKDSMTIVTKSVPQEKVKNNLPELPPIDTLMDFVSEHTVT